MNPSEARRSALRPTLSSLALALLASVPAATAAAPQDGERAAAVIDRIVDESLARGRAYELLRDLCHVAPHRLSGSDGAARAVEWARRTMVELGFENVRLEPCTVPRWERGEIEELVVTAPPELRGERLPILALGGSVPTPAQGVEAEVVVVTSFEELEALAAEGADGAEGSGARGKIVLFNRPMEDAQENTFKAYGGAVEQRVHGAAHAARAGGVAAIVRSMTTRRDDVPHTGGMRYREGVARIPTAAVSTRAADRIAALVERGERVRLRLRLNCRDRDPVESFNVVGEVVGRELPEEIVVVGGHLDAWDVGEGAHDDGAGCVQAMEALRLVLELGITPRRTLRCVLFMNEENGLAGGRAYHETHRAAMERHVLAIESDRGGYTPRGFAADVVREAVPKLERYTALLARTGVESVVPGGGGADIGPMKASGVPLVGFVPDGQRYFDLHHSERDRFEEINQRELHLGAAAVAGLAWLVAEAERPLPRGDAEQAGSR